VAVAGESETVPQGTLVTFDGSDSSDDVDDVEDLLFTWTFDDGGAQVLTGMDPDYTFDNAGVFVVTLLVEDSSGLVSDPATVTITVTDTTDPTADAGEDIEVDMGATVTFDGSGSSDNYDATEDLDYSWLFYDGETRTLTGMTPSYQFDNPDEFSVLLTVTDAAGNEATDTVTVYVADTEAPVAIADADATDVGTGDTVTFDGSGSSDNSGFIASYEWTFTEDGEPVTLSGETATHEFLIPGTYVVTLEVSDEDGNTDTDTVTITVVDDDDPVAVAAADATSVDEGDMVTFDGSGSSDNVAGTLEYVWTFTVDSTPVELTGVSTDYTFEVAGTYEVTLTVTDAEGNSGTDTVTIEVASTAVNEAPVADAGDDQVVVTGTTVTFDGTDSSDDTAIDTYTWTFTYDGAPETLTGESPTFDFDIAGEYTVTLTVEDGEGLTDADTMTVAVGEAPVADAGDDQTVTAGDTVTFDGSGSSDDGTIASYTWTFTYQSVARTLTGVSPTFDFDVAGTYTVTLTVTDDIGLTSTDTVVVTVEADDTLDGDDDKSFIESYGLALGILAALVVAAMAAFFMMKKGKGGKPSPAEPDAPVEGGEEL
jgi:PKD repeat protein